jgi:glucokinase
MKPSNKKFVSIDIGASNLRVALFNEDATLLNKRKSPTMAGNIISTIESCINEMIADAYEISGIGVGIPAPISLQSGHVFSSWNLPAIESLDIKSTLEKMYKVPVAIENDGNLGALGESQFGAGKNLKNMVFVTISTGIGGGVVLNKNLFVGSDGLAAEFGDISLLLNLNGDTNSIVSIERMTSGNSIAKSAVDVLRNNRESIINDLVEGDLEKITAKTVCDAARLHDKLAVQIIKRASFILGIGISNLLTTFNPEVVILGGGVMKSADLFLDEISDAISKTHIQSALKNTKLSLSSLEDDAVLWGSFAYIKDCIQLHK